jgi:hypothetical protein
MFNYRKTGSLCNLVIKQSVYVILFLLILLRAENIYAQDSTNHIGPNINKQITSVIDLDFFTTFAAINVINGETGSDCNNLYLYYNLTASNKLKMGNFQITNFYFTEFGLRKYIDSISAISDDQYNFKNSFSYFIGKSRLAFNLCIISKSQYFKHYDYRPDSLGQMRKYLYTAYLSPGYSNFAGGVKFEFNNNCSMEFGAVNGRKTKIRNQHLFESRETNKLYGLDEGTSKKTEYGYNIIVSIPPHTISKSIYFENFSQINVNRKDVSCIKYYKLDINNAFHYKFLKHFRLTLRTKYFYDIEVSKKPKIINNLTIGFYMNNTF